MSFSLEPSPSAEGIGFQLLEKGWIGRARPVPMVAWPRVDAPELTIPLGRLLAWRDDEAVSETETSVTLPHAVIASLSDAEAARLDLPPPPGFGLHVEHRGTIDQPEFTLVYGWRTAGGQPVLGVARTGCWLTVGSAGRHRLPGHLFELVDAIEAFRMVAESDEAARWRAWTRVQELLPREAVPGVSAERYLTSFVVAHAGSFSLRPRVGPEGFDFDPVLFAPGIAPPLASGEGAEVGLPRPEPEPLLPPALRDKFTNDRFRADDRCHPRYTLADGHYVVLDRDLEAALNVVRTAQRGDRETRRAFARNPRAALRQSLGDRLDEDALEQLFVETAEYSARVKDLGLWQAPVLPWLHRKAGEWFPDDPGTWPKAGLMIGGRPVPIPPERVPELRAQVEAALGDGLPTVTWMDDGAPVQIPATPETLEALEQIPGSVEPGEAPTGQPGKRETAAAAERQVLQIENHFEGVGFERSVASRDDHGADELPSAVSTAFKPHQNEGLTWLKRAWRAGEPGVLLADDMGLGKTLQCLAFLDWVGRSQEWARRRRPFLVVAPTSLLNNWIDEHRHHLRAPGLGDPLKLWGSELRRLRSSPGGESSLTRPGLDAERLRQADWLLTTYETLRDHHLSIAGLPFPVAVFDEAQKIKNPGSLVTWAAKTVNADFVVALTGTPIENRLADLWSIADRAHEGLLGDLRGFSRRYEAEDASEDCLHELKALVSEQRIAGDREHPPFMLRRMKHDQLEGLPEKRIVVRQKPMPEEQAQAYRAAVERARGGQRGDVLKALQALRSISLHPGSADEAADGPEAFVDRAARWQLAFEFLEEIAARGEKALVFLETIGLQPILATLVQKRFALDRQPAIINGRVAGDRRSRHVTEFQQKPPGFDVMVLGPRAAGVGLTLTAANHVIHLTRWWNPAVEDQCTDRTYRIGQSKSVTVWLPQAIHPDRPERSFDLQLHELLERKRTLSRDMLAPPAATDRDAEDLLRATVGDS